MRSKSCFELNECLKSLTLSPLLFVQYYLEPPARLREALQQKGLKPESFFTLNHGESCLIASAEGDVFEWFSPGNPVTKTETYFTHPIQTNSAVNKHSEWSQQCFTYWMFAQPLSWWLKCYLHELRLQGKCDCVTLDCSYTLTLAGLPVKEKKQVNYRDF